MQRMPAGHFGHPGVGLDAEHVAAAGGQEPRHDARSAADIDDPETRHGNEVVEEGGRVPRAGPVVLLGVGAEGLGVFSLLVLHPSNR